MELDKILGRQQIKMRRRMAVAAAADGPVLRACTAAYQRGLAEPVFCGSVKSIQREADMAGVDISGFEVVEAGTEAEAAREAVYLVRTGGADMLMKGLLQTSTLLKAVLDKEAGLRSSGVLSHVGVLHSPVLEKMLLLTDAAMVPYPDLMTKVALIDNAVRVARGLGIDCPRVAALAAVEQVNLKMQATVDAALLTVMNRRGQIKGCIVDGPLAMDLALSKEAALHKGVDSEVAGRADILLFHSIEAANSVLKTFTVAGGCLFGGVVMGAGAPIVLASRSDSEDSKLYSIACAASICDSGC